MAQVSTCAMDVTQTLRPLAYPYIICPNQEREPLSEREDVLMAIAYSPRRVDTTQG